jgi:hypothetical protein
LHKVKQTFQVVQISTGADQLLHYGTNSLRVVITDEGDINYFSMIVSTNACGQ